MAVARSSIIPANGAGIFHCISRCVRRAWLCGVDPLTGQDFSHRKLWVRDRIEELAGIFAVDVFAYAVMSNHLHLVVRIDPQRAAQWSDREVVERWRRLFPWQRDAMGRPVEANEEQMRTWLRNAEQVATWRERLGNLSWIMRCLNEPLARRANREDVCKGRFWEGRFKSQRLCDAGAVLACMAYVDLNPLRAGLVDRPEEAEFTSVRERFEAECARRATDGRATDGASQSDQSKKAEATQTAEARRDPIAAAAWLSPLESMVVDERAEGWGVSLTQYLELVEVTGRMLVEGKVGAIPRELAGVLERLELRSESWLETVEDYRSLFQRLAGSRRQLQQMAESLGQRWFCRGSGAGTVYRNETAGPAAAG